MNELGRVFFLTEGSDDHLAVFSPLYLVEGVAVTGPAKYRPVYYPEIQKIEDFQNQEAAVAYVHCSYHLPQHERDPKPTTTASVSIIYFPSSFDPASIARRES